MLINWVAALSDLVGRGGWHWTIDGKLKMNNVSLAHDVPWLYGPAPIPGLLEDGIDCGYLTILHDHVFGGKAVPLFCMECYKVGVEPKSLEQVHKIADWQQSECAEKEWPCKVGAEARPYSKKVWGAHFYCRGLEEAKERYKEVRAWIDENLGKDVKVFIKRGCTEFEQHAGPSDKWQKVHRQDEIEAEAREVIVYTPPKSGGQPEVLQHHIYDIWDMVDQNSKFPVTYHEEGD